MKFLWMTFARTFIGIFLVLLSLVMCGAAGILLWIILLGVKFVLTHGVWPWVVIGLVGCYFVGWLVEDV